MSVLCGGDPLSCIEFVIVGVGEFLKDWTTMAMLAALLVLLLRLRADHVRSREAEYAKRMAGYADRREGVSQADSTQE